MSQKTPAQLRFEAIKRLQTLRAKYPQGSYYSEVYELALDFALSEKRLADQNFFSRVVSDAKRTLRRAETNLPSICSLFIISDEDEEIENPLAADRHNPEQEVLYREALDLMRQACSKKHRLSIAVFYSMVEGYSVSEAAKKLNLSESMVKKLRSDIIKTARTILLN